MCSISFDEVTEEIEEILTLSRYGFRFELNKHRHRGMDVNDVLSYMDDHVRKNLDEEVVERMKDRNRVVRLVSFPDNPYKKIEVYHHNIPFALGIMLRKLKEHQVDD